MNRTKIPYVDYSWSPIKMKCTPTSPGCQNCWAIAMTKRLAANPSIYRDSQKAYAGGSPYMDHVELETPLHLKKPSRIATMFMGDLFHESVPDDFVDKIFGVIALTKQHQFLVLTKRPIRANEFIWPFPNVHLGISMEDQSQEWRIQELLKIQALKRWMSIEPCLGEVHIEQALTYNKNNLLLEDTGGRYLASLKGIDWIALGAETGPRPRQMKLEWALSIAEQCEAAGVPLFVKQLHLPTPKGFRISHDPQEWPKELQKRDLP